MDKDGYPNWTEGAPEWAFNKATVSQLSNIAAQLEDLGFNVQSQVIFNDEEKIKNEGPKLSVQEYQDCMKGLAIIAEDKDDVFDKDGYGKKVVIETNADDDSIFIQAGFTSTKKDLWNNGIYYHQRFSKDELGKFSNLWDRIITIFIRPNLIPIQTHTRVSTNDTKDLYLQGFIEDGLKNGYVKKIRR